MTEMTSIECCACGVLFSMPKTLRDSYKESGNVFHCPNGHRQQFTSTRSEELQKKIDGLKEECGRLRDRIQEERMLTQHLRNRVRTYKGLLTREKNKNMGKKK